MGCGVRGLCEKVGALGWRMLKGRERRGTGGDGVARRREAFPTA